MRSSNLTKRRERHTKRWFAVVVFGVVVSFIAPGWAESDTSKPTSVLRINAGGGEVADSIGRVWQSDRYALGGQTHSVDTPIAGTNDDVLFQSERWGVAGYDIPVSNGTYALQLLFAEINPASGRRVMDVSVNGQRVLDDFEISTYVGTFRSSVQRFVVRVSDGNLRIRMTASSNSTSIAAIELISTTTSTTPTTSKPTTTSTTQKTTTTVPRTTSSTTSSSTSTTGVAAQNGTGITPSMQGWQLVASDGFSGTAVDRNKWSLYQGLGNEGVGWRSPAQIRVSGGAVHLVGEGDTSGGMSMKTSQTYGRWVIRAKQDKGNGYGPAILLWPDSERWPIDGEIDIAEIPKGDRTRSHFTVHWGADNTTKGFSSTGDFSQWHTWTLEWTADHITVWLDGKVVGTITERAAIPKGPMHLALQNDVGATGHWISPRDSSTPDEVALHVDYVQVYRKG